MATKSTFFACVTMAAYLAAPIQSCPAKCTCEEEFYNRVTVVCEGQGLTSIPLGLPKNTTKLNLSNNNLTVLDFGMLSDLHRLYEIDLSGNEISMFNGSFDMTSVRLFDLSHNNIEFIPRKTFIHAFHKFKSISLRGNPFNCDCNEWNSDLCDCSEDIFSCTCNMQWLKEMINHVHVLWNDEYTLRATLCHKPAAVHNVPITAVDFKPYECETKYRKIVGGTVGVVVVLIIAVVSAYALYKWKKKCCHCYDETNENVGQNIKEEQCELTVNDPTPPSVGHASAHQYQENSGSGSVNSGETNRRVTRGQITDNKQPSGTAEGVEDLIKRNYPLLQERLQVSDLFPHLIKRDFLQFEEKEDISSRTTTQGKADALLELLSRQGKCTSKDFIEILRIGKHKHIIRKLE